MNDKEFFFRLTPDLIINAIEKLGLDPTGHWLQLNSLENRVFSIALYDATHIVVKFYRPGRWTREQINEEHNFLFQLEEAEIPVCAPMSFNGSSLHSIENIYYTVWQRTGGRAVDEFTDDHLKSLGRLLGRIHQIGESEVSKSRVVFDSNTYVHKPLEFLEAGSFLPDNCLSEYKKSALNIADLYNEFASDIPMHRIHGDCHPGNLLYDKDQFFFLDFDDFVTGPAVQDFWMLFQDMGESSYRKREVFLEGYTVFRDFKHEWIKLSEILRGMRFIHYAAWIAKRWEDPAFPLAFPHFGSQGYWEQETSDLRKQVLLIEEELGFTEKVQKVEKLTNKDFFWDM